MEKFRVYGASTKEESQRERNHRTLARKVAAEGMVMLKNDGILPLKNKRIALYGAGVRMTVKGGSGSGDVHERYSINIEQGLLNAGFTFPTTLWLDRFDAKYEADKIMWRNSVEEKIKVYGPIQTMKMFDIIHENPMPYPLATPISDDELTDKTDTAIYVIARQAGEGGDRKVQKGDYMLSDIEMGNIKKLSDHYSKLILVINCGAVMDLSVLDETEINAIIYYSQGGMEGGNAFADIISGKVTPSGKLTDTWAKDYYDYPSAATYSYLSGDLSHNNYYEGIYIGYRWFDAVDKKPRYPFGYGLSYTDFSVAIYNVSIEKTVVKVKAKVKNIGDKYSGKEIIQLYLKKPIGALDHEKKCLVAFAKTKDLLPGEEETVVLCFDVAEQGSFDVNKSAFILEKGEYGVLFGTSSENTTPCAVLELSQDIIIERVRHICKANHSFIDFKYEIGEFLYDSDIKRLSLNPCDFVTVDCCYDKPTVNIAQKIENKISSLSNKELISVCVGGGYNLKCFNIVPGAAGMTAVNLLKKGIPNIVFSDGPAGLNVMQATSIQKDGTPRYPEGLPDDWTWGWLKYFAPFVKAKPGKGRTVYHYMTAFPCSTLRAQTWNTKLLEEVGDAIGKEMLEIGLSIWEAPGMNLHRNPLCGRNFEYYSEDPYLTGIVASAETKGVQKNSGVGVCLKHFCCNNQEENRDHMSSQVSERTLREMYLRPFRIAIKESNPWTVMSSYNMVNGVYTPNSYELCTMVLRNEWGYKGLVMSDWNSTDKCSHHKAILAGNDLIMPGNKSVRKILETALKNGEIKRADLEICAARVLKLIYSSSAAEGF